MSQKTIVTCNKCGAECDTSRRLWTEAFGPNKAREPIDFCEAHGAELQRYLSIPLLSIEVLESTVAALRSNQYDWEAKVSRIVALERELDAVKALSTRDLAVIVEAPPVEASPVEVPPVEVVEASPVEAPAELGKPSLVEA